MCIRDRDGIETYQNMKMLEDNPNKDTTVVMLTANAIMGAKEEYLGIGFSDYLSKPVQAPKLEAMILKYLPEELVQRTTNNLSLIHIFIQIINIRIIT